MKHDPGLGASYSSRHEKREIMKMRNVVECGDFKFDDVMESKGHK